MTRCLFLTLALAMFLAAGPARAEEMKLRWDACGAQGSALRTFACDTNSGSELLVVSFVPPPGVNQMNGLETSLQVTFPTGTATTPSWWSMVSGGCRTNAAFTAAVNPAPAGCVSAWPGSAAGGTVVIPNYSGSAAQLKAVFAVPSTDVMALDPTVEYLASRLSIAHTRSTGTGSCSGCTIPAGLFLQRVRLYQPLGVGDVDVLMDLDSDQLFVNWQCSGTPARDHGWIYGWNFTNCSVATRPSTWGQIKGLYR